MFFVFTEDEKGKYGYVGQEYFSEVQAKDKADDYDCITHIIPADNLVEAKRKLRDRRIKKTGDMGVLYKNVKNAVEEV